MLKIKSKVIKKIYPNRYDKTSNYYLARKNGQWCFVERKKLSWCLFVLFVKFPFYLGLTIIEAFPAFIRTLGNFLRYPLPAKLGVDYRVDYGISDLRKIIKLNKS